MGRLRLFEDMRYCVTRQADKLEFRLSAIISTLANWNLASFPIVGNGLAHSVGEAAFVNVYVVKTAGF